MLDKKNEFEILLSELEKHQLKYINFLKNNNFRLDTFFTQYSEKILRKLRKDFNNFNDFRNLNLTVADVPSEMSNFKYIIFKFLSFLPFSKYLHPQIFILEECFNFAVQKNFLESLKKYPLPKTGNPKTFKKKEFVFTNKWIRHHWLLKLFEKYLEKKNDLKIILDIGSNYGLFEYLLKKKYENKKFILVDLPEKLTIAHFFLKNEFPKAKFLTYNDLSNIKLLDKKIIQDFDFVLLPVFYFNKLDKGSVDLLCNFASFNEMENNWFDYYYKSIPVNTCKYIFTLNRFIKPKYDEDSKDPPISILDFKLNNFSKIHFDVCELYKFSYKSIKLFGIPLYFKKEYHAPLFEYIGERK